MSFQRYPEYKDSGIEWLGDVPLQWEIKRLKYVCHVFPSNVDKKSYDGEIPVLLCNYTDVYYNDIILAETKFMAATATHDQIAKFTLRSGDTIITKDSETADDIAIAAHVPKDMPGIICGYHLSIIRPRSKTNGEFVKRLFDSKYVKSCVAVRANGLTRVGLGKYDIDNLDLPFPPYSEQSKIATFLERETAKIDDLVAKQRRLVELLNEKRQSVISNAVTRGLNPIAPMKPSGIEWLGDVPAHWKVKRIKHLINVLTDYTSNGSFASLAENVNYLAQGYSRLVRLTDLREGLMNEGLYVDEAAHRFLAKSELFGGEVLIANVGAYAGYACLMPHNHGKATLGPNMYLINFNEHLLTNEYGLLCLMTIGIQEQLKLASTSTAQPKLNKENVKTCVMVIPPTLSEQAEILSYVLARSQEFGNLIHESQRAIALLQERRTALNSAAVTGQIDVRNLTPNNV